jgi:hypothetical protein
VHASHPDLSRHCPSSSAPAIVPHAAKSSPVSPRIPATIEDPATGLKLT